MNQTFIQNVIDVRGETGKEWLDRIPELIKKYEVHWEIKIGETFHLSYNYVAQAERSDGTPVVIKLGFPGDKELISECAGLSYFNGEGAIKLLAEDIDNGAMLLERVTPGIPLAELEDDEEATLIAARLLKQLHKEAPDDDRLINFGKNWLGGYTRYREKYSLESGPIPQELFLLGEAINKKHYVDEPEKEYLIHGDFHHHNVLSSNRDGYLTIDTKGVIGNPAYDIATFLYNPKEILKREDIEQITKRRIEIFSKELDMDTQKIIDWGISQALLSTIWTLEDDGKGGENTTKFAQMLSEMK